MPNHRDCPYCGWRASLVTGERVYPHRRDLHMLKFWLCSKCDAWVGCHPRTDIPLGRLANKELRVLKMAAHRTFDPLWKCGSMTRRDAYAWLSRAMNLPPRETHIGMFDEEQCREVVRLCRTLEDL